MSALVFQDTETTGLGLDDDIWEYAAIRREEDGTEARHHLFIQHDTTKCAKLPESFRDDHRRRFPSSATAQWSSGTCSPEEAAAYIAALFTDRPHVVGSVPNFDTERVALLLRRYGHEPGWHYHLIDVENLAVGYLSGSDSMLTIASGGDYPRPAPITLPWDSDELSSACGVEPPSGKDRHTAMGDAAWAMRLYDFIIRG